MYCAKCLERTEKEVACGECGEAPLLKGRYSLEEHLGAGSSGETWRGLDRERGEMVAIKEVAFHRLEGLEAAKLVELEAGALASLKHRGIPRFLDFFTVQEERHLSVYLVMEFIDGRSLDRERAWREEEIFEFLGEMAEILEVLGAGDPPRVHRDIKPENILCRRDGGYVLVDFGTSLEIREEERGRGTIAGTYGFMAPEQFGGESSIASDIYGLGATAIALLGGGDGRGVDCLGAELEGLKCSPGLKALLKAMTAREKAERIQNGRELKEGLIWAKEDRDFEVHRRESGEEGRGMSRLLGSFWGPWLLGAGMYAIYLVLAFPVANLGVLLGQTPGLGWLVDFFGFLHSSEGITATLFASIVVSTGLFLAGPWVEGKLRGEPKWWVQWRRWFRWRGLLRRRGNLRRPGWMNRLGGLIFWGGFSVMGHLLVLFTVLMGLMSLGGEEGLKGFDLLMDQFLLFSVLFFTALGWGIHLKGVREWRGRFLKEVEAHWGEKEARELREAEEVFLLADPKKEMLERAREVIERLEMKVEKEGDPRARRRDLNTLRLVDVERWESEEWHRALAGAERDEAPTMGVVHALRWASEGVAKFSESKSRRAFRAAAILEERVKRGPELSSKAELEEAVRFDFDESFEELEREEREKGGSVKAVEREKEVEVER